MNTSEAKEVAAKLVASREMGSWSQETLTTWLEFDCRCAYCDRDLLKDRGIAYFFSHSDHVLPQSKYPQLINTPTNRVLSCRSCNTIKGDWNPNSANKIVIEPTRSHLTPEERSMLIVATREWLKPMSERNEKQFEIEKKTISDCFKPKGTGMTNS
jgi:hypothetical protein